jgi:hypothetical protein
VCAYTRLSLRGWLYAWLPCSHADVAESIGRELLVYGRRLPKAELFARIDAVDGPTIRAVADRFIYDQVGAGAGGPPRQVAATLCSGHCSMQFVGLCLTIPLP